jgi:hypothetical protein
LKSSPSPGQISLAETSVLDRDAPNQAKVRISRDKLAASYDARFDETLERHVLDTLRAGLRDCQPAGARSDTRAVRVCAPPVTHFAICSM